MNAQKKVVSNEEEDSGLRAKSIKVDDPKPRLDTSGIGYAKNPGVGRRRAKAAKKPISEVTADTTLDIAKPLANLKIANATTTETDYVTPATGMIFLNWYYLGQFKWQIRLVQSQRHLQSSRAISLVRKTSKPSCLRSLIP